MIRTAVAAVLVVLGFGAATAAVTADPAPDAPASLGVPARAGITHPTKVLVIVEENHSYTQMKTQMPYLWSLATRYAYSTNYKAVTHPSLPNYLAIAGGSTFGVTDDANPSAHKINAVSVFDQALANGKTAKTYAETVPANCYLTNSGQYAVRHNPWAYFVPGRANCNRYDVSLGSLAADSKSNALPNVGLVVPNLCNDAHDCPLGTADSWLQARLPTILASSDFTSGRLAVVVTADEDDRRSGNTVLTVVLHATEHGRVVTTALTHYSLSRWLSQTSGSAPLLKATTAPDMRAAFGL